MGRHGARLSWRTDGQFADGRYSRRHEWRFDGGSVIVASSSPEVVPVPMSDPAGVDPEEALVAAVASCHMLWFLDLARRAGFTIAAYEDSAEGEMGRIAAGRLALTRIALRPRVDFEGPPPSETELARLHEEAHARCFIANSLRAEIVVESPALSPG